MQDWPLLVVHLALLGMLLASSLIDFETFTIPSSLPLFAAVVGLAGHGLLMTRTTTGNLFLSADLLLPALGGTLGYLLSVALFQLRIMPLSFPAGEPMLLDRVTWQAEIDAAKAENREPNVPAEPPVEWTRSMLNREMGKELLFILPPLLGFLVGWLLVRFSATGAGWSASLAALPVLPGLLGAALGGLVGAAVIWFTRILGTFGFGKLAMGLGDVHLMAGVGAVTGGTVAASAMFLAAPYALLFAAYGALTRRTREIPFGPYLALGTVTALLLAGPLYAYLSNAAGGLLLILSPTQPPPAP